MDDFNRLLIDNEIKETGTVAESTIDIVLKNNTESENAELLEALENTSVYSYIAEAVFDKLLRRK